MTKLCAPCRCSGEVSGSQGGVVLYGSRADKQQIYVSHTIPLMWAESDRAVLPALPRDARAIHDWARAGKYTPENIPGDEVRTAQEILEGGGDCDDWASLLLAAYSRAGYDVRLVTAGDDGDNFEHVYVEVFTGGQWVPSDPKGSQRGHAFGVESVFPVRRVFDRYSEVFGGNFARGSRGDVQSALGTVNKFDAFAPRTMDSPGGLAHEAAHTVQGSGYNQIDEGVKAFVRTQYIGGTLTYGYRPDNSRAQISGTQKAAINARVAEGVPFNVSRDVWKLINSPVPLNVPAIAQEWAQEGRALTPEETAYLNQIAPLVQQRLALLAQPISDDKFVAAFVAAELPAAQAIAISNAIGVEGTDGERRAAIADYLIVLAGAYGTTLRAGLTQIGIPVPTQDSDLGSAGFFSQITDKIQGAGIKAQDLARQVQTGVGVALQQIGRAVIKLEQKAPWFGTFISRPLGFHLQATALEQLGNAVRDGSITTFDEKILMRATADTLTAAGQAFLIAGAVPSPYSALFIAIGTVSIAAGKFIDGAIDAAETRRAMAADPNYGAVTLRYDSQGRQIDEAGNLVDPYAAQLQALQAQQPAVQIWSYADWGQYGTLPTVFNAQGQPVQVWDGQQWLQVA
jgi:hypothetical protein